MEPLAPGIWWWHAQHPDADGTEDFPTDVASYAVEVGERLFLFDPVAPMPGVLELAQSRDAAVILTTPWHDRNARDLVEALNTPVWLPEPDPETGDSAWLLTERLGEAHLYSPDAGLPSGLQAFRGRKWNEMVVWIESRGALVSGDTLINFGAGLELYSRWLPAGVTRDEAAAELQHLLTLPVEHLLAAHGGPHDLTALQQALA